MNNNAMEQQLKRWRLILGRSVEEQLWQYSPSCPGLSEQEQVMDNALAALYDDTNNDGGGSTGDQGNSRELSAGLGKSAPYLAKWLGDIRTFFPEDVVSVIQNDAIERKGLKQLLFEPEVLGHVKPDIQMVGTLLSLRGKIPEKTKDTARMLVKAVVEELMKRIETDIRRAVTGALNRRQHTPLPSVSGMDWKRTIQRNLKHYNKERGKIIPETFYFFDRARKSQEWTVILDIDQSGSMSDSVIWASVVGSIFASMPSLRTRVVVFDTEVVDLTEQCASDPVDMLFGIQLGGGTDINKSVAYCEQFIEEPNKTIFILISDMCEGGNRSSFVRRMREMRESGVKTIGLLALADGGQPYYDEHLARQLSRDGMPCFACTPQLLPDFVEGALKGKDLFELARRAGVKLV